MRYGYVIYNKCEREGQNLATLATMKRFATRPWQRELRREPNHYPPKPCINAPYRVML
jgi:hypothetical protein